MNAYTLSIVLLSYSLASYGTDEMTLPPKEARTPASQPSTLNALEVKSGTLLSSITDTYVADPEDVDVETNPCLAPPPPDAIVGTEGPDALLGTEGNDVIFGLGGNDSIGGSGGDDVICGGEGNDSISGGEGNDFVDGGAGTDSMTGAGGNDTLKGDAGTDAISGGIGTDQIEGGADDDLLSDWDGAGGDTIDGGPHVIADFCGGDPGDSLLNCNP